MEALRAHYTPHGVQWLLVYIAEAHAEDEWPIGAPVVAVNQHKNTAERAKACKDCADALGIQLPTVLDGTDNEFDDTYASWPLRFYLIDNGIIEHIAMPTEGAYDMTEIDQWLSMKVPQNPF